MLGLLILVDVNGSGREITDSSNQCAPVKFTVISKHRLSSVCNTPTLLAASSENEWSQQNAGAEVWVEDLGVQFCPDCGILTNISLSYH